MDCEVYEIVVNL
jgi:hypothetical protein